MEGKLGTAKIRESSGNCRETKARARGRSLVGLLDQKNGA